MKKLISFRTLAKYCKNFQYYRWSLDRDRRKFKICNYHFKNDILFNIDHECTQKNCPIWKRLKGEWI
jgi:hypothetical protein